MALFDILPEILAFVILLYVMSRYPRISLMLWIIIVTPRLVHPKNRIPWIDMFKETGDIPSVPHVMKTWQRNGMGRRWRWTFEQLYSRQKPMIGKLAKLMNSHNPPINTILAIGAGNGIENAFIGSALINDYNLNVTMILTDLVPNVESWSKLKQFYPFIDFIDGSVDAANVSTSEHIRVRFISGAFHHLDDDIANEFIADSMKKKEPIAILDAPDKFLCPALYTFWTMIVQMAEGIASMNPFQVIITPIIGFWDMTISCYRCRGCENIEKFPAVMADSSFVWECYRSGTNWIFGAPHGLLKNANVINEDKDEL